MIKRCHDFLKACCSIPYAIDAHDGRYGGYVRGERGVARPGGSKLVLGHEVDLGGFEVGREDLDPAGFTRRLSCYPGRELLGVFFPVSMEGFTALT